ncbi:MAG: response regulator [Gammaproteobacteria bacterium]
MNNWGIKKRVLSLALLPTLFIAFSLAFYFNYNRITYIEESLLTKGESLTNLLAPACEHGVFSGNMEILEGLISKSLLENDVINITISNAYGEDLISKSKTLGADKKHSFLALLVDEKLLKLRAPITTTAVEIDDYGEYIEDSFQLIQDTPTLIGYVDITLSTLSTRAQQLDIIIKGIFITFIGLIITAFLAIRISHSVVDPIQRLTNAVKQIAQGNLNTPISIDSGGEIGSLEHGVNTMAEEIQQVRQNLQIQVEKSTAQLKRTLEELEIQNIELDLARNQAISASRIKSEFLANMSHEIRTPMNGVLGFTELLTKTRLDDKQKDFVNTIHSSASNLLTIINDILDFSKIESGKLNIETVSFNLHEVMDEILSMFAPMAYKKDIELIYIPNLDIPCMLDGDPTRLRQILVNLISNAVKFTNKGHVIVRIIINDINRQKINLKFTVNDTGIGMDELNKQRLFTAFTQADTSISRKFGGTGLGLVISKKLAELMDGDIGFESTINKGSSFWLSIPFKLSDVQKALEPALPPLNKTVILFETIAQNRVAIRPLLDSIGVKTLETGRIDKLVTLMETAQVSAIIAGVNRKNIHNTTSIQNLAKTLNTGKFPYITLASAYDNHEIRNIANNGLENIIYRCLRQNQLKQRLYNLVSQNDATATSDNFNISIDNEISKRLQDLHILIVDDNPINIKLARSLLENHSIRVSSANDGEQAIELTDNNIYDMILMDLHMPKYDGFQVTEHIRNTDNPCNKSTIIALTANAMPEEQINVYKTGMNDILIKPITESQLFDIIDRWLMPAPDVDKIAEDTVSYETDNPLIYDPDEATSLAGGNSQLAEELLGMLIKELPEHKSRIELARHENDISQLKQVTHKLHGATSYCGVPMLRIRARELENLIDTQQVDDLDDHYNDLLTAIDELIDYHQQRQ